jgi:hypothetical protein
MNCGGWTSSRRNTNLDHSASSDLDNNSCFLLLDLVASLFGTTTFHPSIFQHNLYTSHRKMVALPLVRPCSPTMARSHLLSLTTAIPLADTHRRPTHLPRSKSPSSRKPSPSSYVFAPLLFTTVVLTQQQDKDGDGTSITPLPPLQEPNLDSHLDRRIISTRINTVAQVKSPPRSWAPSCALSARTPASRSSRT